MRDSKFVESYSPELRDIDKSIIKLVIVTMLWDKKKNSAPKVSRKYEFKTKPVPVIAKEPINKMDIKITTLEITNSDWATTLLRPS